MTDVVTTSNTQTILVGDAAATVIVLQPAVDVITAGTQGPQGVGIPSGGTTGQLLKKNSNADFDAGWVTPAYVPYTGATADVALGSFGISSSGRLSIPNGASVVAANVGDIALDTTDNQLLTGGAAPLVLAQPKKIVSVTIQNPTAADDRPIFQMPYAATITKITATVLGATSVTFNLQKHAANTLNSAGTNMLTSSLVATTTGANSTSFSAATLAAGDFVSFVSSALSGAPTAVILSIEYTITRT